MKKTNIIQVDFMKRKTRNLVPILWVESDNFEGFITNQAYRDLTLEMSSGDYGSHIKETRWVEKAEYEKLIAANQITFCLNKEF